MTYYKDQLLFKTQQVDKLQSKIEELNIKIEMLENQIASYE